MIRPVVLLVPSRAAALELPRRLASKGRAVTGLYPMTLSDLVRALAEPALLGRGLAPWDGGHDALLAARLLDGSHGLALDPALPRGPVALALARTLSLLRREGVDPALVESATRAAGDPQDAARVRAVGALYRAFHGAVEGRFADPAAMARAARAQAAAAPWLRGAEVLVAGELEAPAEERALLAALARTVPVRRLPFTAPAALEPRTFAAWAGAHGIPETAWAEGVLAPLAPPETPEPLGRLRTMLFEPPAGTAAAGDAVELVTAPGEAAEVRALARRLLREAARGIPFEEMGVVLPRPAEYAPLLADLFARLSIPYRLHPSLPLLHGRTARALLLLFRCRGLERAAVMEFLTFAPVPFEELLGGVRAVPARWDKVSRDAGIVSGLERWMIGLRAFAEHQLGEAARAAEDWRKRRAQDQAVDAESLLRLVELVGATLDALSGRAPWAEWAERLRGVVDQWIAPTSRDRQAVLDVVADLGSLSFLDNDAAWDEVEQVLEARFEWERLPLDPVASGAVHVGALDALSGLSFRVLAIPGLVEGGYPGVVRPDPFLLDPEREAISRAAADAAIPSAPPPGRKGVSPQLSLLDAIEDAPAPKPVWRNPVDEPARLPTQQDRVADLRREFHRAVSQATERLILSYPRADARNGRERLPSLFFVAAATALAGRPLSASQLEAMVTEDALDALRLEEALDPGERDRARVRRGGDPAALAVAAGSPFFLQSRLAARARWSNRLTAYDGLVHPLPEALAARLDPCQSPYPISASRLAVYAQCGYRYFVENVLRAEAALEPEERLGLDPLERGSAFHDTAERYLRACRDGGRLPVRDTPEERAALLACGDEVLDEVVAHAPPRFTVLWDRTRQRFRADLLAWLAREAREAGKSTPAHFEVQFGVSRAADTAEPHAAEPIEVDLGDGRTLRVSGKIDRIDRRADGLVLRDYKTGRRPRDEALYRGGRQLQIPFYVLAAARLFPGERVVDAFLDYVDGGGQVAFPPERVLTPRFHELLRAMVDAMAQGLFVQDPSACEWCDFKAVCGPAPLLERRRAYKTSDPRLQRVLRLRDFA